MLPEPIPDLLTLDLFSSVIQLGSLSRAAALHRMSQPSASERMRKLERVLGVPLLERTPSGSKPTPQGTLVAEWVTSVLTSAEGLLRCSQALTRPPSPSLRIAASYTIAEYLAPSWLLDLQRMHPDAEVHLEVTNSAHVVERLVCKEVDIGFIETSTIPEVLVGTVVARDELVVVTRPDHALAQRAGVTVSML